MNNDFGMAVTSPLVSGHGDVAYRRVLGEQSPRELVGDREQQVASARQHHLETLRVEMLAAEDEAFRA